MSGGAGSEGRALAETRRQVRATLTRLGLRPSRRLGQNFLVDPNLAGAVVRDASLLEGEVVLEVGPGLGTLTTRLLEGGHRVVAVEVDSRLAGELSRRLGGPLLTVVEGDVLAGKHRLAGNVVEALRQVLAEQGGGWSLVANLPYQVSVPVVMLGLTLEPAPRRVVVMVQLEVAARLVAAPGTASYGAVSVLTQALSRPAMRRRVPPEVFHPRPRVASAVVELDVLPARGGADRPSPELLRQVVRACFRHPRRQLRRALAGLWPALNGPGIEALAREAGLAVTQRPGEVPVEAYLRLARQLESETD